MICKISTGIIEKQTPSQLTQRPQLAWSGTVNNTDWLLCRLWTRFCLSGSQRDAVLHLASRGRCVKGRFSRIQRPNKFYPRVLPLSGPAITDSRVNLEDGDRCRDR